MTIKRKSKSDRSEKTTLAPHGIREEFPGVLEDEARVFRFQRAELPPVEAPVLSREQILHILDESLGSWSDLDIDTLIAEVYEARRDGTIADDER